MVNQNPEQIARDKIDVLLRQAGWAVQGKSELNFGAGLGVAVREYQTDVGPADYVLFVDRRAVGVIEAKREEEGQNLTVVEKQSEDYATAKLKWVTNNEPLPFIYESTGEITRFRDMRDPKPRSRETFSFHRPETFQEWLRQDDALRSRLLKIPGLLTDGLRDCQINAITRLETSFQQNRPRALVQMATGSGKTFTAITFIYRLLKHAGAKRILFLVDTKNLGEQAEQEFMAYMPNDDNRKFTELYSVQRLKNSYIARDSQVCISTIQRLYSILKGEQLDESAELENPAEHAQKKEPFPVVYNEKVPLEFFDFIVIDECHRSIYNLWKQVLDYFDAFLIGLTATPDKRTFGFFDENVVSEYSHEDAVADGVNVGHDVYTIETKISKQGETIEAKQMVEYRDKLTRKQRWAQSDKPIEYDAKQLDKSVVNKSQIRKIIGTFRKKMPEIFPQRDEVPKTLIFAKTDKLYSTALAPMRLKSRIRMDYRKSVNREHVYLYIRNGDDLAKLAEGYDSHADFFKTLESTYISDLIAEVRIKVRVKGIDGALTFRELSEGEQQLITVLGLLEFTKEDESLFLLDEPDTHLNPRWSMDYYEVLRSVLSEQDNSQIVMTTHDPLVISEMKRESVLLLNRDEENGQITAEHPEYDPQGMGIAGILTSEMFNLRTTIDNKTMELIDRRAELFAKGENRSTEETVEMQLLFDQLARLGFNREYSDPYFAKFVQSYFEHLPKKEILSDEERNRADEMANRILEEILEEKA